MRKIVLLLIIVCSSVVSYSQDFSNKGKDFWVAYGYHQVMSPATGGAQQMVLYFATDQVTTITISIPGTGYTQTMISGAGNNVLTSAPIPKTGTQDARLTAESTAPENKGIHIVSDKPIVAYAHIYNASVSGATILFPTNTLGKEYYSINFTNISNTTNSNCWFYVIATDPGTTTVEITPSVATINHPAGVPFTVTLTQGQVFNVMATFNNNASPQSGGDLTGSKIRSISSGTGGCKRIAVFSGSGRISITCNGNASSSDNYMTQAFPKTAWGKKFLTAHTGGLINNIYRICVTDPATLVKINGVPIAVPLQGNFYYQLAATSAQLKIEANLPITVAQYITSQGACGNGSPGDPEVIYLSSVEQNISKVNWNAPSQFNINEQYFNVVIPNTGTAISSFKLKNALGTVLPVGAFTVHPGDPAYSYLVQQLPSSGVYSVESDSGFNAIAYGFGNAESYGYNAGTNVRDLYQQISVTTQYGIEQIPSVCTGSPFKFKISLPYQPDSMYWNFYNFPTGSPYPNVMVNGPIIPDSTTVVNTKTIYWYSLPSYYNYSPIGNYPVTITTYTANSEGCGNMQDIDFTLEVSDPPVADFSWTIPRCVADTVRFTDISTTVKPTYKWWWDFGDPASGALNNSSLKNPQHVFTAPGTYIVRFANITTPGCLSDTIPRTIVVAPMPTASINGTTQVCLNGPSPQVSFTGSGGSAPYTFTYSINGGASQFITTTTGNSATVTVPTGIAGSFSYALQNVQNTGSIRCTQVQADTVVITVRPLPTASITGATTVCQDAPSPVITFTAAGSSAPYTFTYSINGGTNQTITTTSGNTVSVPVPTSSPGSFTYTLVSVQDGSTTLCSQFQTGASTVIVRPLPTAIISGSTSVCLNAPSPNIIFTGNSGTAPYTFTYNINGGANQVIITSAGNSVTIPVPTDIAGTYTYNLVSVREGSTNNCVQTQTGSAVVTINALPSASISGSTAVCQNATTPVVTFTGSGSVAPYSFTYNINGGPAQTITSTGNIATLNVPTNIAGSFTYNLVSVRDASVTACSRSILSSAVITVNPLPTATISGATTVCLNAASPNITFTGSGTTAAAYTFTYTVNGGPNQVISTVSGNSVNVPVPTNIAGSFTYSLVRVQEGSVTLCVQDQAGSVTVNVNPLPSAVVGGSTEVCLGAPSPNVIFTGSGAIAPYTFTYTINNGPALTVTSTGNSATVAVPTNTAGTYTYTLLGVRDGSSTLCSQQQAGSASIVVNPLPTAQFSSSLPLCVNRITSFTDASNANAGSIVNWSWNFNDPASGTSNVSALQFPTHVFSTAGTYQVSLAVTTDKGCISQSYTQPVVINKLPRPGFIIPEVCLLDPFAAFTDTSNIDAPATVTGWQWNFGDAASGAGNISTVQHATHTYSAVGDYTVQLIATSNAGCTDTLSQVLTINGGNPIADFITLNPASFCSNDSISIQDKSTIASGNITKVEIHWDNVGQPAVFQVDDFPSFNNIYRHKYPTSTSTRNYTIRFRSYSGGVCVSDKIQTITVFAAPVVQFNAIPDACFDAAPFLLTQASETGSVPGIFEFSGPGISATGLFNPAVAGIGLHTIWYTYTAAAGGCKDSASRQIRVLDTAQALFTVTLPICEGNAASFSDNSTSPAGVQLTSTVWDFGDGSPIETHPAGSSFTHIFPAATTYSVTMYTISAVGCRSTTATRQVIVSPRPRPGFMVDKTSYCLPNAKVTFNSNSSIADGTENSFTYLWDFGDPGSGTLNSSTARSPIHTYTGTGPYQVNLSVSSGVGCTHDTTIIVNTIHPQPKASFDTDKPAICFGDLVSFRDLSDPKDGTTLNWVWDFGDNSGSTDQHPPHLYPRPGNFPVTLYIINSFGCNSDTLTKVFNVNPFPVVDAGPDRFVLEGGSIILQPNVTGNDLQYLWMPDRYLNNNTISGPLVTPLDDITYTLMVTARGGCSISDQVFVKVLKGPVIPNTFSPNNDGINDFWEIRYLETYPNNRVQVFTRTGHLVFESRGYRNPWNGTMNGKSLPVDTYYYIIEPENGRKPVTGYVTIVK